MKRIVRARGVLGLIVTTLALAVLAIGASSASASAGTVTRTFSLIARPNSKTVTLVNIDSLLINARCSANGSPVIFAFTSAGSADLLGRIFDGLGRVHIVHNTAFTNQSKGVGLWPSSGDFDATGTVLFETSKGAVVTVNYAFDNSTTLNRQNVCTVFGSFIAT
jgi:hypothetical protein